MATVQYSRGYIIKGRKRVFEEKMTQLILPAYKFLERLLTFSDDVGVEGPTTRRVESRLARSHMVRPPCQAMISPRSVELEIHDLSMFRCYDPGQSSVDIDQLDQSQGLQPNGLLSICCQPQMYGGIKNKLLQLLETCLTC